MSNKPFDIMLDLETMGTGPNAAIVAIGAVAFDLQAGTIGDHWYRWVDHGCRDWAGIKPRSDIQTRSIAAGETVLSAARCLAL